MRKSISSRNRRRQRGQGMSEYLAATALVGVAAVGTLGMFGDTLQSQFSNMALEIAGEDGDQARTQAMGQAQAAQANAGTAKNLGNFATENNNE